MDLTEAKAAGLSAWFDPDFADLVTYNGVQIYGHVSYGGRNDVPHADHAVLTVACKDVPAPQYRDTVEIDGQTWRVFQDEGQSAFIEGDGLTWTLPIFKGERKAL